MRGIGIDMMNIVIDAMGGDNAPGEIVKGALEALELIEDRITLVGDEAAIRKELKRQKYDESRLEIVHTTEVITMEDAPVKAVRRKKDSSMVVGINMVKEGKGDLFISAGSTGALMAAGLFNFGRIQGIDRPAIATIYPVAGKEPSFMVDGGANSECKPQNYLQFAAMGSIYMEKVLGRRDPTIGLVNIGTEPTKGTANIKEAYRLLSNSSMNFIGNVEAREIPRGACDVIVCDGFVGNVIMKLTEGFAMSLMGLLKKKFTEGVKAKLGAAMLLDKMKDIKKEFDYSSYGGAPILGVKGHMIKMHGSSEARAVKNAIVRGIPYARENVAQIISDAVFELEEVELEESMV